MTSIFKSLSPTDYSIIPFPAYYKFSYTYQSGSTTNSEDVVLSYASQFLTSSGLVRYPNSSQELYDSVIQTFYSPIPKAAYGITSMSYSPSGSVYVISVTQNVFGETIAPGSFSITVVGTQSYDDGKGNLIVSSSGVGGVVGRIFYDKGIALFKPTSSATAVLNNNGLSVPNAANVKIDFSSSVSLYEHSYRIRLNPTDFLYPLNNPSINTQFSGSTRTALDLLVSQSILPYVTTIGLYNEQNELLLVAKPSVPIQRTSDVIQTFIIKFDI